MAKKVLTVSQCFHGGHYLLQKAAVPFGILQDPFKSKFHCFIDYHEGMVLNNYELLDKMAHCKSKGTLKILN